MATKKQTAASKKPVVSKITGEPVDPKRSRAAKKAAVTRRATAERVTNKRALRLHHKLISGGLIAAVLVLAFLGVKNQIDAYAATSTPGVIFIGIAGKCLDNHHSVAADHNQIQLYHCNATSAQKWTVSSDGSIHSGNNSNYCIDVPGNSKSQQVTLQLYHCNGTGAQRFKVTGTQIVSATTGFCAGTKNGGTSNSTPIWMTTCLSGSPSQRWAPQGLSSSSISGSSTATGSIPSVMTPSSTSVSSVWSAGFASRPTTSSPINCNGQSNVTISGHTFSNIGSDIPAITINNCTNVTITANDFVNDCEPIYVVNSKNVTISWNRYQNITGPHTRNGSNRGNFTQWVNSFDGSISHNKGVGGDTEDIVSIYKSGGSSAGSPLIIEDNAFEGTNWTSQSGSGMMLGDGGGAHIIARNNTLVNPGQAGIGISGGSDIHVTGNKLLGQQRTSSNIGIYVANYSGGTMSGEEVSNNQIDWRNASGVNNPLWTDNSAGSIAGWSTNDGNASLSLSSLAVSL